MRVNPLINALAKAAGRPVLSTPGGASWTGQQVTQQAQRWAANLHSNDARCVALEMDNSPEWVFIDLACQLRGIPMVPVPAFFSPRQRQHLLTDAGVDLVLGSPGQPGAGFIACASADTCVPAWKRSAGAPASEALTVPADTARVTYTSGTTGTPKGVCLSFDTLDSVAAALATAVKTSAAERHLCVLPLAVLLENVAGVYTSLLLGSEVILPPLSEAGLSGSSGFDPEVLLECANKNRAHSMILLPQMLKALVAEMHGSAARLEHARFVAVGGARTAGKLLIEARALGIPVFEGYGLSECGSVVCLNTPQADRPGSVGRPLAHTDVRIATDGEVLVRGPQRLCYAGSLPAADEWIATGDIGHRDAEGFIHLQGRKNSVIVTGFGRNVSPEWVESELLAQPGIAQAVVAGNDLPGLLALLVPAAGSSQEQVASSVAAANLQLPDYARIQAWRVVPAFFTVPGAVTSNGKTRRAAVEEHYADLLANMAQSIDSRQKHTTREHTDHGFLPGTA